VQQEHVDSFLANLMLADTLCATDPAEAVRYYQAALAIRPRSATAHNNLAVALEKLGRSQEALRELQAALALDNASQAIRRNLLGLKLPEH
jgi:Flp pilus assembly protein TadD